MTQDDDADWRSALTAVLPPRQLCISASPLARASATLLALHSAAACAIAYDVSTLSGNSTNAAIKADSAHTHLAFADKDTPVTQPARMSLALRRRALAMKGDPDAPMAEAFKALLLLLLLRR